MIGTACCFYKVVQKIHIPLAGNNPLIPFEARFRFLRDLAALNNSMMLLLKLLLLRSKVSRLSNLGKLSKLVVDLLKNCRKKNYAIHNI
jgi:hypothetical protein